MTTTRPVLDALIGRDAETERIDRMLERVTLEGAALTVSGAPGIGKSALVDRAADMATRRGMVVLRTAGVQAEAQLPLAGLHQLLQPVLDRVDDLPPPQRDALRAAFGVTRADPPGTFMIALATLNLLSDVAARTPLAVIAEDAQWLDAPTCAVLSFVGRRVGSDRIVLLITSREGAETALDASDLPALRLGPLDAGSAATLLDAHAPHLTGATRLRLLTAAAGNPLALVELPVSWRERSDEPLLTDLLPLTARVEHAFAARVGDLPTSARELLSVAAANDSEMVDETLQAGSLMAASNLTIEDLAPAISSRFVELSGTQLRFRHPLVRSAIYQHTRPPVRRAAHAALAGILRDQPDRRAWHLAAAATAPDETVAAELESSAARAFRRQGIAAAAAALARAAQLTPDDERRGARLLHAAELAFQLGRQDVVAQLLDQADRLDLSASAQVRRMWVRELAADSFSRLDRVGTTVDLADQMRRAGHPHLALNALRTAATVCWFANPDQSTRDQLVATAERLDIADDDPKLLATIASADPLGRGADVVERATRRNPDPMADPEQMHHTAVALNAVAAFDSAGAFLDAAITGLRRQGRLGLLAHALTQYALASMYTGTATTALTAAGEARRLARETSQPRLEACALAAAAVVAGRCGDEPAAAAFIGEAESVLQPMAPTALIGFLRLAGGSLALGAGRPDEAFDQLQRIFDPTDIAHHTVLRVWALADLVDAAVHSGHHGAANDAVRDLTRVADTSASSLLRVSLAYARPLLQSDDPHARELFRNGLERIPTAWPFIRARLQVAYGGWLRRHRHVAESRTTLRAARDAFDLLGAAPWARNARQELRASGETSPTRTPYARSRLTPQELQIAHMAGTGLSNREIGQQLYLSHRTVASHLYRIYPKLGITSRAELRDRLEH